MSMRNGLIAALDVGSTKVCCFLARVQEDGHPRIVGIGHQVARGMRAGAVVDLEELEHSIRASVDAAEDMAGERVKAVVVNRVGRRARVHQRQGGSGDERPRRQRSRHPPHAGPRSRPITKAPTAT